VSCRRSGGFETVVVGGSELAFFPSLHRARGSKAARLLTTRWKICRGEEVVGLDKGFRSSVVSAKKDKIARWVRTGELKASDATTTRPERLPPDFFSCSILISEAGLLTAPTVSSSHTVGTLRIEGARKRCAKERRSLSSSTFDR